MLQNLLALRVQGLHWDHLWKERYDFLAKTPHLNNIGGLALCFKFLLAFTVSQTTKYINYSSLYFLQSICDF